MRVPVFSLVVAACAMSGCERAPARPVAPPPAPARLDGVVDATSPPPASPGIAALDALPWEERLAFEQALAASDTRYAPHLDEGGPVLETPGSVVATFTEAGARLSFGRRDATLRVAALGRDGALRVLSSAGVVTVAGAEVRTARGSVLEWWRSLPSGLEHGVTIAERPSGDGRLDVEVAVTGDLRARWISDDAIELRDGAGTHVATYAHLVVRDATDARIPAHMAMDGDRIVLAIDDTDAVYPLAIDPLVTAQEATLLAPDGAPSNEFGWSVAFSADGTRALVGAYRDPAGGVNAGSAGVFLRTGSTWAHEAKLFAPDRAVGDEFGYSVALSADGSRALIGVRGDGTVSPTVGAGSARVFVRTGTSWAQEAVLLAPDGESGDYFGRSVALSGDGSRALVGASSDDTVGGTSAGSARVFLRSGSSWSHEASLLAPDGAMGDNLGHSVALSADGSRALVGAIYDDIGGVDAGSARSFVRTGTTWTHEATLYASDGAAYEYFGRSVALSSDGSRGLVGAYFDDAAGRTECGTARVFLRTGTTWTEEATLLAPDAGAFDHAGASVALSADGARALVGASGDDTVGGQDAGSAHVFVRVGTTWTREAALLAPDGAIWDALGSSVALSSDGSRGLLGAPGDGSDRGSARVFTLPIRANGEPCSGGDAECLSGFCTDGVCCSTRCGGGGADCQACSAALTGGASGTCAPLSPTVAPTVVCRASSGALCDTADTCTSTSTTCPDVFVTAGTLCRAAAGACDVADLCDGLGTACPDARAVGGTTCRPPTGSCDRREACDGVSVTCPPDEIESSGVTCRPGAGPCDAAERCSGLSGDCPSDAVAAAGTSCGPAPTSACDAPDTCNGISTSCPNAYQPATTPCGPSVAGLCDAPDHCSGTSADCVAEFLVDVVCRPMAGACDLPESCVGTDANCPMDAFLAAGAGCGGTGTGSCSSPGTCTGIAAACPGATLFAAGTVCLPATPGNPCDVDDLCDGSTDVCQPAFAPATTACGSVVSGVCDAPDHCMGTTAGCVAEFLVGVECRPAAGACDSPEICGAAATCPVDQSEPAGMPCRTSTDLSCDPEEVCDGVAATCPEDATTCVARPDADFTDGGAGVDAALTPPVAAEGCACRLTPNRTWHPALWVALGACGTFFIRRRRRR